MITLTRKLSTLSLYIALCAVIGFLFAPMPNVELITLFVFLGGYFFGMMNGLLIGCAAMFIFSAFNPWGSGLAFPPMLAAQVISFGLTGFTGGLVYTVFSGFDSVGFKSIVFGIIGGLLTALYSVFLALFSSLSAGFRLEQFWIFLVGGIWIMWNIVSNVIFFAVLAPRLIGIAQKFAVFSDFRASDNKE